MQLREQGVAQELGIHVAEGIGCSIGNMVYMQLREQGVAQGIWAVAKTDWVLDWALDQFLLIYLELVYLLSFVVIFFSSTELACPFNQKPVDCVQYSTVHSGKVGDVLSSGAEHSAETPDHAGTFDFDTHKVCICKMYKCTYVRAHTVLYTQIYILYNAPFLHFPTFYFRDKRIIKFQRFWPYFN